MYQALCPHKLLLDGDDINLGPNLHVSGTVPEV
jgi:hypothetical protein